MSVTLMHGDCLDILKMLDAGSVDAVVTDPPYGIEYVLEWQKDNGADRFAPMNNNSGFDPAPFLDFPTVVLFGANHYSDRLPIGSWLCWDKRLDETKDKMFGASFELAWFKSQHTKAKSKMIRVLHGGVINADSQNGNNQKRWHPTQKPVEVMRRIILEITEPGETILDPFMGSGTTGVACVQTGRNFIGIELDEGYYRIAEKRIAEAQMQLSLPLLETA